MSRPLAISYAGVTVSSPPSVAKVAGSLFTRTEETFSRKSRLNVDRLSVVRARIVVVPDSRSVAGW
jgi:hypothetical protein